LVGCIAREIQMFMEGVQEEPDGEEGRPGEDGG
jgi:hypothetical protein